MIGITIIGIIGIYGTVGTDGIVGTIGSRVIGEMLRFKMRLQQTGTTVPIKENEINLPNPYYNFVSILIPIAPF